MAKRDKPFDAEAFALKASRESIIGEIKRAIYRSSSSVRELARRCDCSEDLVRELLHEMIQAGIAIHRSGDWAWIEPGHVPPVLPNEGHAWKGETYRFGLISDTHYGSKYAREDVCHSLYDWFKSEGIERVYHAGNWVEGIAKFNRFDLIPQAHGMQAQLDYFAKNYPARKGIRTYIVSGDDHEGWWSQREGVNIGQMMQDTAERHGRKDLIDIGYMEAFVTLTHAKSGRSSRMLVAHPGGGSAYAVSYTSQKIIESFQPGEKPAVALFGHYHKIEYLLTRGVHAIQAGCTKDLDPFGRKKRLAYHIGGAIIELRQSPDGSIPDCLTWFRQFSDRGQHNDQFAHSHEPTRTRAR